MGGVRFGNFAAVFQALRPCRFVLAFFVFHAPGFLSYAPILLSTIIPYFLEGEHKVRALHPDLARTAPLPPILGESECVRRGERG